MRLDEGISLKTDSWHRRYYWSNAGGSHHMAVLCYQLKQQRIEWSPLVSVTDFQLNPDSLSSINGKYSIYVTMNTKQYFRIFERLPYAVTNNYPFVDFKLGVSTTPWKGSGSVSSYQLVIIDHRKEFSDLSFTRLESLVSNGRAMKLEGFIRAWMNY